MLEESRDLKYHVNGRIPMDITRGPQIHSFSAYLYSDSKLLSTDKNKLLEIFFGKELLEILWLPSRIMYVTIN